MFFFYLILIIWLLLFLGDGDNICKIGHTGVMCESCDLYNKTGHGNFGKSCIQLLNF